MFCQSSMPYGLDVWLSAEIPSDLASSGVSDCSSQGPMGPSLISRLPHLEGPENHEYPETRTVSDGASTTQPKNQWWMYFIISR